ncbi:MAG: beta-lactamase family protein [Acidimicrobiia bacterium]|nr:beta-lactamase family protein [Acidimicrobiia bacterium]
MQERVDALVTRARREVDDGLLPSCQLALAYEGELVVDEVFGDATTDSRYCLYSATKAIVATAMWTVISDGLIDVERPVADYFPEFAANGKQAVSVRHVLLHQCGFPNAPLPPSEWADRAKRIERMAAWTLDWEPGARFIYHATSAHWVLAELIERTTGQDFRDYIEARVTGPAGLPRMVGVPLAEQADCQPMSLVGDLATTEEIQATFGVPRLIGREMIEELVLWFNEPPNREVGVPGAGGFGRARDLALFYQELLHNPHGIWEPAMLARGTGQVESSLPDPMKVPANRSLGLILAGDDGYSSARGLGRTVSAGAFGHNGAGGQLAWADPASGLSLGYTTNGFDRHEVRQPKRGAAIGALAALCRTP